MSLSSPHHEQPAIFDSDLEIDCESSGSLNTSYYDSESESETKIGKKLRMRGDYPVTGKFSSDSAHSDLESEEEAGSDSSEEKEESSSEEKEESSSYSPDSSSSSDDKDPPPAKRYRPSPDKLAPKQHRIIVTRKRLTNEHLSLLKSRNLLPDTQDTDNDCVSECEATVEEGKEIEEKGEEEEQDENEKDDGEKAEEVEPIRTLLSVEEENSTFGGSEPILSPDHPKEDKLGVFDWKDEVKNASNSSDQIERCVTKDPRLRIIQQTRVQKQVPRHKKPCFKYKGKLNVNYRQKIIDKRNCMFKGAFKHKKQFILCASYRKRKRKHAKSELQNTIFNSSPKKQELSEVLTLSHPDTLGDTDSAGGTDNLSNRYNTVQKTMADISVSVDRSQNTDMLTNVTHDTSTFSTAPVAEILQYASPDGVQEGIWEQNVETKESFVEGFLSPKWVEKSSQGSQFSGLKTDDVVFNEQLRAAGDSGNAEETVLCAENIANNNAQPTEEIEVSESIENTRKEIPSSVIDQGSYVLDTRREISAQLPENKVVAVSSPVDSSSSLRVHAHEKELNWRLMSDYMLNKFKSSRNIDIEDIDDSFNIKMAASAKLTKLGKGMSGANGSDKLVTSEMKTLLKKETIPRKSKDVFEFCDEGNPTPAMQMSSRKRRKLKPPLSEVNSVTSTHFAASNVDDNVKAQLSYIFNTTTPAKMSPSFSPPSKESLPSLTLNNVPTKESKEQFSQSPLEITDLYTTVLETTPLPDDKSSSTQHHSDDITLIKEIQGEMPKQPPPQVQTARFDPFVPEVAKALNYCICDHVNVGMLLTVEQIKKKAWPYRIESILLSLIGDKKLPHCRYCTETTGPQRGVAETLSDSCFLFSWASEYRGSSWVHTIPLLKTEHVEALKGGAGSCYPCLGQCGIVSCGFKSLSVATLRRHIKERCTAAIKYSSPTVQEEYETGRLVQAVNILKSKSEARKLNRDVVNERDSVWSDNCNLSHSLNSTKVQRDYKGSKQPSQSFLKPDRLDMFDMRILQLVQLLNTNDTDLLIDVLTCCFYNTLSCERCWKKVGMSEFLPNSWKRTSGQHYEHCTRPSRPTSHKSTSTRDLDSRRGVEKHFHGVSDEGVSNNIHSERGRRYIKGSVADLKSRIRAKRNRSYLEKEEMRKRRDIRVKTVRKSDSSQVRPGNAGPKTRSRSSRGSENASFEKPRSSSRESVPNETSGKQSQTSLRPKRLRKSKETSKSASVLPSNTTPDAKGDHSYSVQKSWKGSGSIKSKRDIPGLAIKPQSSSSTSASKPSSVSRGQVCLPVTSSSAINSRTVTSDSEHVTNNPSGEIPLPVSSPQTPHPDQVPEIFPFPDVSPVKTRSSPTNTTPSPVNSTAISYSSAILSAPLLTQPSISNLSIASLTWKRSQQPSTTQTPTRKVAIPISSSVFSPGNSLFPYLSEFQRASFNNNVMVVGGKVPVSLHSKNPVSVKTVSSLSQVVVDKSRPATMRVPVHKRVPVPRTNFVKCNTFSDLQSVLNSPKFLNSPTPSTHPKLAPVASPIFIAPGDATSGNTSSVLSEAAAKAGLRLHISSTATEAPFRSPSEKSAASLPDSGHPPTTAPHQVPPALSQDPPLPSTSEKLSLVSACKSPDTLQSVNINVTDTPADMVREELESTDNDLLTVKGDVSLPQSTCNVKVAETTKELSPMLDSTNNTITPPDDPDCVPELNPTLFSNQDDSVRRSQRIKVSSIQVETDKPALLSKENGDEPRGSSNMTGEQRNMLSSGQLFLKTNDELVAEAKNLFKSYNLMAGHSLRSRNSLANNLATKLNKLIVNRAPEQNKNQNTSSNSNTVGLSGNSQECQEEMTFSDFPSVRTRSKSNVKDLEVSEFESTPILTRSEVNEIMKATGTVPIREQSIVPQNSSAPSVVSDNSLVFPSEKANGLNVDDRMTRSGRKRTVAAHQASEADRNTRSDSSIIKQSDSDKKRIERETTTTTNSDDKDSLGLNNGTIPENMKLIKSPSLRRRKQIVPPSVPPADTTNPTSEQSPTRKAKRPLTLTKRSPVVRDMTPLPDPWDDTVKVKLRGSTVFISRGELAGGYPDILNKLSVALLVRPDDIRSVTNTTSSTQLKPGQDTFSRTLQRDDSLAVSLRRPTEASDQSATAADEDLEHLQNVLLVLVRFPVSAPEDTISSKRVVWVANIFTSTPGYTSYVLTNGAKGSLRDDHVTYMKFGDSVSSISYLGSSVVTPDSSEIGPILEQFSKLSDVVAIAARDPENAIYLKYWYRDHIFTCFLLNDFTLQIDFSLSQTSVVLNMKKDYYCHLRSDSVLDEGSLSFKVLSSELSDKLAYVANIALPTIIEDVTS